MAKWRQAWRNKKEKKTKKNTKAKANAKAKAKEEETVEKYILQMSQTAAKGNNVRLGRHSALYNQIYIDKFISTHSCGCVGVCVGCT